jgi:hypothetical protein
MKRTKPALANNLKLQNFYLAPEKKKVGSNFAILKTLD